MSLRREKEKISKSLDDREMELLLELVNGYLFRLMSREKLALNQLYYGIEQENEQISNKELANWIFTEAAKLDYRYTRWWSIFRRPRMIIEFKNRIENQLKTNIDIE